MKTKMSTMMVAKPVVIIKEKIVFVLTDIQSQFSDLSKFLGFEPSIKIDNGILKIKITGHKPFTIGNVIVTDGENVENIISLVDFQNQYEVVSDYYLPIFEKQIEESSNQETKN